jgi:hypothetical protein
MRAVNLLPRDIAQANSIRNEDPAVVIGSVLGAVVMIVLAAAFMAAHSQAGADQKKLTAARLELGKLSQIKRPASKKPAFVRPIIPVPAVISSQEQPLLTAISTAMSSRIAWDKILREFSLVVPSDVTISALTMTAPVNPTSVATPGVAPTAPLTQTVSITGSAYSHDSVARLLSRLMLIPDLTDVTLANSSAASSASSTSVQFSITASVKAAVQPAAPVATAPTSATGTTTTTGAA